MHPRLASVIAFKLLVGCLASTAQAQIASVRGRGNTTSFDTTKKEWEFSLASVNILSGDTLEIPKEAVRPAFGGVGKRIMFDIETLPESFPAPGIFGLRLRDGNGSILPGPTGLPLEVFTYIGGVPHAASFWGWEIPDRNLPVDDFTMELLGQSGGVVARLNITPAECDSCQTGYCSSDPSLRSVHFEIPVGLTDVESDVGPQMVKLDFYQEDIPLAGAGSIRLRAPQSSSIVPTYGSGGKIQSVRVGERLAVVQEIPGPNPGDPTGLDVTVSSDWQNPATTVIRKVTMRNKVDGSSNTYLEFDEQIGSHHSITAYRKTSGGDWIMETGDGLRRETRMKNETATVRTVRVKVEERTALAVGSTPATYAVVSDVTTVSNRFPWGWREVEHLVGDPSGPNLVTTTTYYGTGEDSSLDSSNSDEGYGRVKQVIHSTGEIQKHYYFTPASGPYDKVHVAKRAFAGTQEARETTTESLSGLDPLTGLSLTVSRVTERAAGHILSRRLTTQEARADGVFSEERIYSSDTVYTSKYTFSGDDGSVSVVNPDGTASLSSQVTNTTSGYTTSSQISGYVTNDPSSGDPQIQPVSSSEVLTDKYREEISNSRYHHKDGVQVLVARKVATNFDSSNRAVRFEHFVEGNDDPVFVTEKEYGCCGLVRERDQQGIDTFYGYDALKRQVLSNRNGVTTQTVRAGLTASIHRYEQVVPTGGFVALPGSAAPSNETSRAVVDLFGNTTEQWHRSPQDGSLVKTTIETSYDIGSGIGRRTVTQPPVVADDGAVVPSRVDEFFLDGRPASSTGNLGPNRGYRYSANATGPAVESFLLDGTSEKESTISQSDWARRETSTLYSSDQDGVGGNDHSGSFYNAKGQLWKTVDPDGVTMLYGYNQRGEQTYTALDLNNNGVIDLAVDRVSFSETDLAARPDGEWVMRTSGKSWLDTGSDQGTATTYKDVSLDGLRSWTILNPSVQGKEAKSVTTLVSPGILSQVITRANGTSEVTAQVNGLVTSVTEKDANGTVLYQIENGYDSLKRAHTQTDSRSGTTTQHYVSTASDIVNRTVDSQNRETLGTFDHRGRQKSSKLPATNDEVGNPVGNLSIIRHYPDGRVQEQTGDGNYRTTWTYDYAGRPATLTTYGTVTAITRWIYDASRGFLTGKRYNSPSPGSGSGPSYTYSAAGRVKTRTQARLVSGSPLVTTYTYGTAAGSTAADLDQVSHSDGTPGLSISLRDRLGRPKEMLDAAGDRSFDYARHGDLESDTVTSGILAGQKIEQGFDSLLRSRSRTASIGTEALGTTTYSYGASGAVRSVSGNGQSATYHYHAGKRVLERVTYLKEGETTPWLESTRKHDGANRLTRITTHVEDGGAMKAVDHHAYGYDELDRISSHTDISGAAWTYGYNARGEVGAAVKSLPGSSTEVNGRAYRYHFDGIGNRTLVEQSRDSGQTARSYGYTPDALNHYTSTTHPSFVDVAGTAAPAASVTVNSQTVTRQGGFFRKELSEDNSAGPEWIAAEVTDGVTTTDGSVALPAATITPVYDEDGNLKFDGLWNYTWDAENRLIRCERTAALVGAGAPYLRLEYDYDSQSRRIRTSTFTSSGAGSPATRTLFVFDGWRCVAELDALSGNQALRKYTWGLDLAGDIGDSSTGNVGALLWVVDTAASKTHVYLFARNGNVSGLVDSVSRNRSATYDYDAFGQLTVCYGDYARKNPFTFSTKFTDFASGLCYYGYRWYSPSFGRWISRDPIEESGGTNLLGFVGNNGLRWIDYLGLDSFSYKGPTGWERIAWFGKDMFAIAFEEASEAGARAAAVEATMSQSGSCDFVAKANGLLMFAGDLSGLLNIVELAPGVDGEFIVASDGLIGQRQFNGIGDELLHAGGGILKFELLVVGAKGMKPKVRLKVEPVPGTCFVGGTEIETEAGGRKIESLQVGERVLTTDGDSTTEVNPETWRKITLKMPNPECSSDILDLELLRPVSWLASTGCLPGTRMWFELEEMGLRGWAEVESVRECPPIPSGRGRVVLATVTHYNTFVMEVRLEGHEEALRPTDRHRLFSVTRNEWVPTVQLKPGEELRTAGGIARIASIQPWPGMHRVFNIEVETEHSFFAGRAKVLSHNTNPCAMPLTLTGTGTKPAQQLVDLTDFRAPHILNRHRPGAGKSKKTEFPASWSDQEILHHISDVATDPASVMGIGKYNSPYAIGIRDGIEIRVDFYPTGHPTHAGKISTAYPINVPPNP